MSSPAEFQFYWARSQWAHPPEGWELASEANFHEVEGRAESVADPGDFSPGWAQDLLQVARAVYVADKRAPRTSAADGWTRRIHLSVPLSETQPWENEVARRLLHDLLATLTGDSWDLEFRTGGHVHSRQGSLLDVLVPTQVALLSGGLDSTAFAASTTSCANEETLFILFQDPDIKQCQLRIIEYLQALRSRDLLWSQISQTVQGPERNLESSSRSRGLLYLAEAIYVAAAYDIQKVYVPENGQLAANLPLSPGRVGACSTRSVHPRTLRIVNDLITVVGGHVAVVNPFRDLTKGDVCRRGHDAGLTPEILFSTVSCGHSPRKRRREAPFHCGYCYPCLVRRAGLLSALGYDQTPYWHEPWSLPYRDEKAADLRDVLLWLSTPLTVRNVIADVPLPDHVQPAALLPVLRRARRELQAMLDAQMPASSLFRRNWDPVQ
jgi:Queuosine biosynthesis protein QueC